MIMKRRLCSFCHNQTDFRKGKEIVQPSIAFHTFLHIEEKELFCEITNEQNEITHKAKFPIKYCPICGKKLTS